MRDYGKVHASFWTSETTRSMSEDARSLSLYLLTCPHNTIAGVFRLPDGYVCDDMQWASERVAKAFNETLLKGFANRCETTKWVWINNHFQWNPPENPNQRKCAVKIVESIPDTCSWKLVFMRDCAEFLGMKIEPLRNPLETLAEPEAVTVTVTEAGTGTELLQPRSENFPAEISIAPAKADAPKLQVVPADETEIQAASRETWAAYAEAYADRYGTKPVRNAKINGQVKQLVQRLGRAESPPVAAFYVRHSNAFYVRNGHDIGSLLAGCEKLRTEWATGRMVTVTSAQQADRTQSNANAAREAIESLRAKGYA